VPSASSGVRPLETRRRSGTTACLARDQSHAQSRAAAGRRSSMARTHPLTRSDGGFRPQRHQRARRHGRRLNQFNYLLWPAHYFNLGFLCPRASDVGSCIGVRTLVASAVVHAKEARPCVGRPITSSVRQLMFGDLVWTLRPDPDDFGPIAIVAVPRFSVDDFAAVCRVPADVALGRACTWCAASLQPRTTLAGAATRAALVWARFGHRLYTRPAANGEGAEVETPAPVVRHCGSGTANGSAPPWCVTPPGRRPSPLRRTGGRRWRPAPVAPRTASRSRR